MAVAAAGVATALPGLTSTLATADDEVPAAESAITGDAAAIVSEPLVAHVRDLPSGEISLFSGTREVILHDPGLANRLFNATR